MGQVLPPVYIAWGLNYQKALQLQVVGEEQIELRALSIWH